MNSTAFQSYPVDHFISIVQAWVHQAWPITAAEGRRVYESLGMRPHAADPGLFMSHFAVGGEPDAYFTEHEGLINTVRMQIGRPCPPGTEGQNGARYRPVLRRVLRFGRTGIRAEHAHAQARGRRGNRLDPG